MKKSQLQQLVREVLQEVEITSKEKPIVDDILNSLTESSVSNVVDKIKNYGKKGLVTLAILSSVVQGLKAQNIPSSDINAITKTGIEVMVQNTKWPVDPFSKQALSNLSQDTQNNIFSIAEQNGWMVFAGASKIIDQSVSNASSNMNFIASDLGTKFKTVYEKTFKSNSGVYVYVIFAKPNL